MSDAPRYKMYVDIAAVTIAFVGISTYFFGEYLKEVRDRRGAVYDLVGALQSDPLLGKRLTILKAFSDVRTQAFLASGPPGGELSRYVGAKVDGSPELWGALIRVVYFFDELQTCIDASRCHRETARSWLLADASEVDRLFGSYVNESAAQFGLPRLGCGLAKFSDAPLSVRCITAMSVN